MELTPIVLKKLKCVGKKYLIMGKKQKIKNEIRTKPCNIHGVVFSEVRAEVCDCGHPHYFWPFKRGNVCMNYGKPKSQT